MKHSKEIPQEEFETLCGVLQKRFLKNMSRHPKGTWTEVQSRLDSFQSGTLPQKGVVWSLHQMEATGGEPDVVGQAGPSGEIDFYDCAPESPKGRRSVCYDDKALESRKMHKPAHSAVGMAAGMGIALLTEAQYRGLQKFGPFDTKTSSWLATPTDMRKLGGAIFGDYRYGKVFIYHNGAESYYGARGFRGLLRV